VERMKHYRYILGLTLIIVGLLGACENPTDDGGELRFPYEPTAGIGFAAWSNSGDLIAYKAGFNDSGEFAPDLYLTDTTGGPRIPMGIDASYFQWLEGDSVMLVSVGGAMAFINRFTKEVEPVAGLSIQLPVFSYYEDKQIIYFVGEPMSTDWAFGIYQFDLSDRSTTFIVDGASPALSPDGTKLAFARSGVFVIDLMSRQMTELTHDDGSLPTWTPDGRFVVFEAGDRRNILKTDLSGRVSVIVEGSETSQVSPDGRRIIFQKRDSTRTKHIWMANMDGTNVKKVSR
jgi:WD40-like Beta Propeller Repeat